jgi:hypothetical protein
MFSILRPMNRLPIAKRVQILGLLVEGSSLRATSRLADVSINTVTKLLVDLGEACAEYHHRNVRDVRVRRLQCDEIWAFVGAKRKNASPEKKAQGWGDVWTWVALDADTKLCVSYLVGRRGAWWAYEFMRECAKRVRGRVQLTNAFSKKVDNHAAMVAIHFLHYNFARIHKTLRVTPAMAAGLSDHVWSLEQIVLLSN